MRSDNKLTIFHDDNSVFADYTNEAFDYSIDEFSFALSSTVDYLYIGYYKPINSIYVELKTPNVNANSFTVEYYNSYTSIWEAVTGLHDNTKGLIRSGFINWDRNLDYITTNTVNSIERIWYRFRPSADHTSTDFWGINIIFADDQDLENEFPTLKANFLSTGETSFIRTHVATRNDIMQILRNRGNTKVKLDTYLEALSIKEEFRAVANITPWDILDKGEIRQAATYKSLSKIFQNTSDNPEDSYAVKAKFYSDSFETAFNLYTLSLDSNDDGLTSSKEQAKSAIRIMDR